MGVKTEATVDDLARVPGKAELVGGELVLMSPTAGLPGLASVEITSSLRQYARRTRSGRAFGDNVGFLVELPHRKSFSPDAAFPTGPVTISFVTGAPVFAVEVRRGNDYGPAAEPAMSEKRADDFTAGTLLVWDVDLQGDDVVRSYRAAAPANPTVFRLGETASAEPSVPGWSMAVDDIHG